MSPAEWLQANAALLPHQVAGVALLCVAVWLLLFHAQVASIRHFAGFLLGYGAAIVLSSIELASSATESVLRASASVAFFYCTAALLLCVLAFPRSVHPAVASPGAALAPAVVALLAAVGFVVGGEPGEAYSYAAGIGNALIACSVAIAFMRLAREPPGSARRSLLLLAVGVSLQEVYFTTFSVTLIILGASPYPLGTLILWGNLAAIVIVLAGAAPLVATAAAKDKDLARTARLALVGIPVGATTGILSAFFVNNEWVANLGALWRLVFVALVTWGILRHQFLGVDLRVRWAIGRSTVAAVFITVFFVASEAAQQFLGDTTGSAYLGIAAAGALVFAIAPLQRAAERLAEKAVPGATDPQRTATVRDTHEAAYKAAVRLALRGGISRREEIDLARIAEAHALSPLRALELRHEVEESHGPEGAT